MKKSILENTTHYLRFQRNIFAALAVLLSISLIIISTFLFLKKERVIIVPPTIEKEFWVDGKQISATYLEQIGYFLGQLLLSKSPYSSSSQRTILFRHSDPAFIGVLKQKLLSEEELLKKQNASYVFYPISIQTDLQKNQVLLEGDRVFYVSGKQVSSERESYLLSFRYTGSRLLLSGINFTDKKGK